MSNGFYVENCIGVDSLYYLVLIDEAWEFDSEVFDKIDPATNLPYGYKLKKEMNHEYAIIEETV